MFSYFWRRAVSLWWIFVFLTKTDFKNSMQLVRLSYKHMTVNAQIYVLCCFHRKQTTTTNSFRSLKLTKQQQACISTC